MNDDIHPDSWRAFLDEDETLIWEGQPSRKVLILRKSDLFMIPFSLAWASIGVPAGFMIMMAGLVNFSLQALFGAVFFFAGLYITVGRFILDVMDRRRTRYALTNKRAFIAKRFFGKSLRELALTSDLEIEWTQGNLQTIRLGPTTPNRRGNGRSSAFAFADLSDGARAYQLIRQIQNK